MLQWNRQEQLVGFRSLEKIAPSRRVKHGAKVFPLRRAARPLDLPGAAAFMQQNDVVGLIVLKGSDILLERYALGFRPTDGWMSFSVAKSITSTLIGCALNDGKIKSVDDPVTAYLPAFKGSAYDGVTVRQILNMTSGVKWNEDYSDPESDVAKCHRAPSLVGYLAKLPRDAEPGTKFVYKTAETDLAGEIVMAATGKHLNEYLSEKIWSRFGMERDAFIMTRANQEYGGCCFSIGLRDYARFALFFKSGDGLPAGWAHDALTPTAASKGTYGYMWWIDPAAPGLYSARGIFGQSIRFIPQDDVVIVLLSAWPTPLDVKRREAETAFQTSVIETLHRVR